MSQTRTRIFSTICSTPYSGSEDGQDRPRKQKKKIQNAKTTDLKAELKNLLSQPLISKGISTRYITSGSRSIVDDLVAGECTLSLPSW